MRKRLLFHSPQMQRVAETIVAQGRYIKLGKIDWNTFPDSWSNFFIHDFKKLRKRHVTFLACLDSPKTVFEQLSIIHMIAKARPRSFRILLPYFPTGTMERVDMEGQVPTASTLAHFLSAIPPAGPGPIPLYIWDIHALPIRHYFGDHLCPRFKSGTKQLKKRLKSEDVSIAFPDEGAWKRFQVMFLHKDKTPKFPFIVCRKQRDGNKRVVTVSEGDPSGKHVVIVDDLIHSGGTTIECMRALKQAGAARVSVYATHGVMEGEAWRKFVDAGFERVWITDSFPATAEAVKDVAPFEVLSLVPSLIDAILDG